MSVDEQVIPRSFISNATVELGNRPFDNIQREIVKKHILKIKSESKNAFEILNKKRRHFEASIPADWKNILEDFCYINMRKKVYSDLKKNHEHKIKLWIQRSPWNTDANENYVVNLSNKQLNRDMICALGYGLNYAISSNKVNSVEVSKGLCNLEKYSDISSENINIIKGIVYSNMKDSENNNYPKRFRKALDCLKKDENIHITKADKSGATVILNRSDYIEKMNTLLRDENTYKELTKNPIDNVNSNFNKKVKTLLKGNENLIKKFCVTSPSLPYMYGLIKTHKENFPARPIISSVGSATYNLSKYLVEILNPLIGTISDAHIKNNVDLLNKLNNVQLNSNVKLISFDVVSLFTKVPIDDMLDYLSEFLDTAEIELPFSNNTLIELIKLCIKDCKFEFNGKYYSQNFGMSMGNPLSPLLSNLYMEFFESRILSTILPENVAWFRYIDDIICIWPDIEDVNSFFNRLNNLVPSIKFTMELEDDNCSLPFLDCRIHRGNNNFKFSIYRKPTNIAAYVHFYSGHSLKIKKSVFTSMFLRAFRICSPEFFDNEIETIRNIGRKLKYPENLLDDAFRMARKTFYDPKKEPYNTKNMLVLPYNENFKDIPRLLKNFNVNVAFKNNHTIRNMLIKNSPDETKGCVYSIPCNRCDKFYIGQTGKFLEKRLEQHKKSVRYAQENNAVFCHVRDCNHSINWQESKKIAMSNNVLERNIIESSFIKESFDKNMNISLGMYKLDPYICKEICKLYAFG